MGPGGQRRQQKVAIAKEEGALVALVALLREGSAVGKENAAAALQNLAANADNKVVIAKEEGALAALVALLREGSAEGKENAAGALWSLAVNADNKRWPSPRRRARWRRWWRCCAREARWARRRRRAR